MEGSQKSCARQRPLAVGQSQDHWLSRHCHVSDCVHVDDCDFGRRYCCAVSCMVSSRDSLKRAGALLARVEWPKAAILSGARLLRRLCVADSRAVAARLMTTFSRPFLSVCFVYVSEYLLYLLLFCCCVLIFNSANTAEEERNVILTHQIL